jgi:surface antigen
MTLAILAGCGVPQMVGDTTQAALSPATSIARSASSTVTQSVSAVSQSAATTGTQAARAFSQSSANMANSLRTTTTTATALTRAATQSSGPPPLTAEQKAAFAKAKTLGQEDLKILPEETLTKLTEDERGMQNAAQIAALTAPVGETIFWTNADRTGSAVAEEETKFGEATCRKFEQSVTIDGSPKKASAIACRNQESNLWALSF